MSQVTDKTRDEKQTPQAARSHRADGASADHAAITPLRYAGRHKRHAEQRMSEPGNHSLAQSVSEMLEGPAVWHRCKMTLVM